MKYPGLIIEKKQNLPILILDKEGLIGKKLCQKLSLESQIVFVTQGEFSFENVIVIPFSKSFPTIPDASYSHIFIIDDEFQETKDFIDPFINKAENDRAFFIFVINIRNYYLLERVPKLNEYEKAKIIFYGDIFDKGYKFKSTASKFINQAEREGRIDVPGDGLGIFYPIFFDDLVLGILESVFGGQGTIFFLFPKHPITYLSFAHMIQKENPQIKIDFKKTKREEKEIKTPSGGKYVFENYDLSDRIKKLNIGKDYVFQKHDEGKKFFEGEFKVSLKWILFTIIFFLLLPALSTLSFSFLGYKSLDAVKTNLEKGNIDSAQTFSNFARGFFLAASKGSEILLFEGGLIGREERVDNLVNLIEEGEDSSLGAIIFLNGVRSFSSVFAGKTNNPTQSFYEGTNSFKNALVYFQKNSIRNNQFRDFDPLITFLTNTVSVWPNIFGIDSKKTYLLLFQNNMELRPGGGFIGSYGLLTLDKGKVSDFSINDVYDADGQLKGHVEPPYPLRRYLPSTHWYLRDSNFNVDFEESASSSANFLNLERGIAIDGVIGLDLSFAKKILEAIGPLYIADYNETIDSKNFFKLAQIHSEKNFFPSSRQKKDFLNAVFLAIQNSLGEKSEKKSIPYLSLAKGIADSISEKHLIFAFDNKGVQNIFTVNGWSASLWDARADAPTFVKDFQGIVEANLGVNKANLFVKREVSKALKIDENGEVVSNLTITYKNESNGNEFRGDYKNYLRIILPKDSKISQIKIDNLAQETEAAITDPLVYEAKNFTPSSKLELEKYEQAGKTIYGFLVTVPKSSSKIISIDYKIPQISSLSSSSGFSFSLKIFKQPGVDSYPYSFSLIFPDSFNLVKSSEKVQREKNEIKFSKDISADSELKLDFFKR